MTPHARAKAGSDQARFSPLWLSGRCALLVLAQLYLAITLAALMLTLAVMLIIAAALVTISSRRTADVTV